MHRLLLSLLACCLCFSASAECSASIIGTWRFTNDQLEIVTEFLPDGTFRQVNATAKGRETYTGRYQLMGQTLFVQPREAPQPQQIQCRFPDADTILATYPSGETLQWKRVRPAAGPEKPSKPPGAAAPGLGGGRRQAADAPHAAHVGAQ